MFAFYKKVVDKSPVLSYTCREIHLYISGIFNRYLIFSGMKQSLLISVKAGPFDVS